MTTLHLIRDSALNNNSISLALTNLAADDNVVLLDDGCYNINQSFIEAVQTIILPSQCFALEIHVLARSLPSTRVTLISYTRLLELFVTHHNVITWQ